MLILARKVNDQVAVDGGRIIVTVVSIRGDWVKLGFQAPDDVVVDRMEIHELKLREANGHGPHSAT